MAVETFLVDAIDWLKNVNFDEIVFGEPGKVVGYCLAGILWLYIALMIYKDAEHRYREGAKSKYYWIVVAILLGPVGWLLYLALRPVVDLDESYLQRVEERYLSFESRGLGYCAKCGNAVDPDFLFCTSCGSKIRERCKKCEHIVEKVYAYCPACGAKMRGKPKVVLLSATEVDKAEKIKAERELAVAGKKAGKKGIISAETIAGKDGSKDKIKPFFTFLGEKVKNGWLKVKNGVSNMVVSLKPKPKAKVEKPTKSKKNENEPKTEAEAVETEKSTEEIEAVPPEESVVGGEPVVQP